jgi:hypothetical protein
MRKFSSVLPPIVLILMLAAVMPAMAGGHKVIKPMVPITVDADIEAGVKATVLATAEAWNSQDYSNVLDLWDPAEPFPTYLAEEQAQWFVGWDRLREYLDPPRPSPAVEVLREEMFKIQVKQIGPQLAIAIWEMQFEMKSTFGKPIGEHVRVSAVLRNTDEGWRYIHWAESPKTAMVYIEDLFETQVAPGWDEYYEAALARKKEVWRKKRAEQKMQKED